MEKILNIPTAISHSCFTFFGEIIHLKEKELNYFYSLLYLYRENIKDESKKKIFTKIGNKHTLNEAFETIPVRIELSQFDSLGVVHNKTYKDLKHFIIKLNNRRIVINILGKDKRLDIKPLKMIEEYRIEDNVLYLKLTEEFLRLFLHTEKYYMSVNLNLLFRIKGYKSKRLYLMVKDYKNYKNECIKITQENFEKIIGRIPSKETIQTVIDGINTVMVDNDKNNISDIKIEYPSVEGNKIKKYEFKFRDLSKSNPIPSIKKPKTVINTEIMEKTQKKIQKMKEKGKKFDNEAGYIQTVYKKEVEIYEKSIQISEPKPKTDTELLIDKWIEDEITKLKQTNNIQFKHYNYLCIVLPSNDDKKDEFLMDREYKLFYYGDFDRKRRTHSSEETYDFLDYFGDRITTKVHCTYYEEYKDIELTQIR